MARKPTSQPPKHPAMLTPGQMKAGIDLLQKRIDAIKRFDPKTVTEQFHAPELDKLSDAIDEALVRTFGTDTLDYERYKHAKEFDLGPMNYMNPTPPSVFQPYLEKSKERSIARLEQAIDSLKEKLEERPETVLDETDTQSNRSPVYSRRIFIVHGHDEGVKATVARFIEKIGFEPVILHEQPNKGRTIITKFREEAADVGFAVVLMTPDDQGAIVTSSDLNLRARQNVVFELGFFFGALGPERVAAIVKGDIERPSDFDGVVYISFDTGSWQVDIARELRAAGYEVDFNKIL